MANLIQKALLTVATGLICLLATDTPSKKSKLNLEQYNLNQLFKYEIQKDKKHNLENLFKYTTDTQSKSFDLNQLVKYD